MPLYTYNAYLRFEGVVEYPTDCPANCETTDDELPAQPWPDAFWPYYLDDGWELVDESNKN